LAPVSCAKDSPLRPDVNKSGEGPAAIKVPFLTDPSDPRSARALTGAKLAAEEVSKGGGLLGRPVAVVEVKASARSLAGFTDDADVAAVLVASGSEAIEKTEVALEMDPLPVIELFDDLYDLGRSKQTVFQASPPHSWQAFRLARYFGAGDRKYSKIGVAAEPGHVGDAATAAMREAGTARGLEVVSASGTPEEVTAKMKSQRPQVVVVEGSTDFITKATSLIHEAGPYQGRSKIYDGYRPQIAGFESMLQLTPPVPGWVGAGDYARPELVGDRIDSVKAFRSAFKSKYNKDPVGDEVRGYTAVHVIAEAVKAAGVLQHSKVIDQLETFDRKRFGHLPVSLGPTDHVLAERDVLGLFAYSTASSQKGWRHLMRAFTSDLERTNALEEDWASFFDGTTPGGEAPFYHSAKVGITSDSKDDLH